MASQRSVLENQFPGAKRAIELAFGLPIERKKAEAPLSLDVHGLNRASAVRTRPGSHLPSENPLVLVAHEHQTHRRSIELSSVSTRDNSVAEKMGDYFAVWLLRKLGYFSIEEVLLIVWVFIEREREREVLEKYGRDWKIFRGFG